MFTSIESQFWTDEKVREWGDDVKLLSLYFMTTPYRNLLGCFVFPLVFAKEDLKWTSKRLKKAFDRLETDGFLQFEVRTRLLFIKNFLKYHPIQNAKHLKHAVNVFESLPRTPMLRPVEAALNEAAARYGVEPMKPIPYAIPYRIPYGIQEEVEGKGLIEGQGKGKESAERETKTLKIPSDDFISTQSQNPESKSKPSPSEEPGVNQTPDDSANLQVKGNGEAPASVQIYEELTGHALAKGRWSMMDRTIGENSDALGLWERIVRGWITQGWELKLDVMVCDYFQLGIVPGECRQATPGSCQRTLAGVS